MEFIISTLQNTFSGICITYTCISITALYFKKSTSHSYLVRLFIGVLTGFVSLYLFNIGEPMHNSLYIVINAPITFGFILFGYPALLAGLMINVLFIFGKSSYFDIVTLLYFISLIVFYYKGKIGINYVIYSYLIAQSVNIIVHFRDMAGEEYWSFVVAKTIMSLSFLLLLYVIFSKVLNLMKSESYLKIVSKLDPLTGVGNRRCIDDYLSELVNSDDGFFCIIMLDIDNFKSINDNFGHPFGDKVIFKVAQIIKKNVRSNDFVGRYGGEEFIIIIKSELDNAVRIADKIRVLIQDYRGFFDKNEGMYVTVSIGVAKSDPGLSIESIISNSDSALYKAKKTGKNKVSVC